MLSSYLQELNLRNDKYSFMTNAAEKAESEVNFGLININF